MRTFNEQEHTHKKEEIMKACFDCYAKYGLNNVGIKKLGEYCNIASGSLYTYFDNLDDLIVQSTEYCMSKVEDEFMEKAPTSPSDIERFIDEIPYWTAKEHGEKYRLMYQVYTNPKYISYGKKFFEGVNERYTSYAKLLESKINMPYKTILSFIFILIRACVHYAMFEDEFYLKTQLEILKVGIQRFLKK